MMCTLRKKVSSSAVDVLHRIFKSESSMYLNYDSINRTSELINKIFNQTKVHTICECFMKCIYFGLHLD